MSLLNCIDISLEIYLMNKVMRYKQAFIPSVFEPAMIFTFMPMVLYLLQIFLESNEVNLASSENETSKPLVT